MSDIVIRVEDLWKKYRLGVLGTGTLSDDLNRWWHRVRGKPDPYALVGEARSAEVINQIFGLTSDLRPPTSGSSPLREDEIWALRGVSFEVKQTKSSASSAATAPARARC